MFKDQVCSEICGLTTGIGSLPLHDPEEALSLIFKYLEIPHWPQLPQRGAVEGFINQFLTPLCRHGLLEVNATGGDAKWAVAQPDWSDRLTSFYQSFLQAETGEESAVEQFAFPPEAAAGFYALVDALSAGRWGGVRWVKGHIAGPITIALQLKLPDGRPSYYEPQLRDLVVKTLVAHARWQVKKLRESGAKVIIFIDEPAVRVYGQFSYITITREMLINDLAEIIAAAKEAGAVVGVHACDAVDWSILVEAGVDIINLDAFNYGLSLYPFAATINDFLQQGGVIAWGIVPTNEMAWQETENSLLERLKGYWQELNARGVPLELLSRRYLITPACGTGLLERQLAEQIYRLTATVGAALR